jgi:hypothetical protein
MSLPHAMFLGVLVAIRIFFPSVVRWISHDTYVTAFLSVGYPLFSTLMWVHARRHPQHLDNKPPSVPNPNNSMSSSGNLLKLKSITKSKTTSHTNSNVPPAYSRSNLAVTCNGASLPVPSNNVSTSKDAVVYWLRYWHCVSSNCGTNS